jgi:hypothetical protein
MASEHPISMRPGWQQRLALIGNPHIIRRALTAALVVGTILILLNQGDLIVSGQITRRVIIKSLLTPIIPFCVTMLGALLNAATPAQPEALRPGKAAVRRSLIIAAIVGSVIIALNQGDIILSGAITPLILAKVLMTPCVPFCVSLYGAYIAYRHAVASQQP